MRNKLKYILLNSHFFIRSDYIEYEGYFKGRKLDTECYKNKPLEEVKRKLYKNEEFRLLEEKTEKRNITENGEDKEINVKKIKFEILEKSSIKIIESEFFQDNLSKYLKENVKFNISYNSIIEILKNYKDENNVSKPIEIGKDSNGIVEIKIYNDDKLINIDDGNKGNVLNFTRIHFIFTQDLYKICPVKISIKTLDSYKNKDRKYCKNRYNEFVCVENGLKLKDLFNNIATDKIDEYDEKEHKKMEYDKYNKYDKDNKDYILNIFLNSPFNINSIKTFKTIKKIKFKYINSGKIDTIYDEAVNNGNIEEFLKNENFKYSYLGEYIIETDFLDDNNFYIHIMFKCGKLKSDSHFGFNKTITVSQFKEFLKASNIIKDKDLLKITKNKIKIFGVSEIELKDSDILGCSNNSNDSNYEDSRCYNCNIEISDIDEFKDRKFLDDLKLGNYLQFSDFIPEKKCKCGSSK